MREKLLKKLLIVVSLVFSASMAIGQGATSSSMNGLVSDSNGESLPGANVVAVHEPSGTRYGTVTNIDGRYSLANMRIGGPYTVRVSYVGFEDKVFENVNLSLGQPFVLNARIKEGVELTEFQVTAFSNDALNSERTGAATKISTEKIEKMPTISRGFNDFTRFTPQAQIKGNAISIAGANNRYNQVTIDGAVSNDVFGLAGSGTNGGQTGTSPISLDAIEEFNVQIAPYDVRIGGFGGGAISAVTRSGTNDVKGSAYYYFRNQNLAGKTPGSIYNQALQNDPNAERTAFNNFSDRQYGARVGGAVVKDKLFYFLSVERTESETPLAFEPGSGESNITAEEALLVANITREQYGYDPGDWQSLSTTNESTKLFARLDWNINDRSNLTLRHAFTYGEAVQLSRNPNQLVFSNGAILRESTTNATVAELSTNLGDGKSNNLIIGYTTVREPRSGPGDPFPRVRINIGTNRNIQLGTEAFSTVNQLDQDVLTLTDNFSMLKGKHNITIGTHNEYYNIYNAFIGQAFGAYQFANIADYQAGNAQSFTYQYSRTANPREGASFRALQLGVYVQDEYRASENLKVTAGVRLDVPIYLDEPLRNDDFNNSEIGFSLLGQNNNDMPKPAFMVSPRVGFNWDVNGDRSTQVRGGTGIFTSRFPFVWVSGAFTQNGILLGRNQVNTPQGADPNIPFNPDPNNQDRGDIDAFTPNGNMTIIDQNFKLPQVWRTNIGVDQVVGNGYIFTFDAMYSMNINSFRFNNVNLADPIGTLGGADNRQLWAANPANRIVPRYTETIYVTNANEGYSWNLTAQVQKSWDFGLYASLAYSYTEATDLFAGTSSQNQSNFYRRPTVNGSNNVEASTNPFDTRSRVTGILSYGKEYGGLAGTYFSLFYTGQSGNPFSFIVNGDLNRSTFSGAASNHYSLIYVPANSSEIVFRQNGDVTPEQQWEQFNAFIEQDPYLSTRRGDYAERNGARTPWTNQFDVKIVQDLFTNIGENRNTLQLSLDIFNFGNLLNKDWGRQFTYGQSFFDDTFQLLRLRGYGPDNTPEFTFEPVRDNEPFFTSDSPIGGSRWVAQIGIRYIFN